MSPPPIGSIFSVHRCSSGLEPSGSWHFGGRSSSEGKGGSRLNDRAPWPLIATFIIANTVDAKTSAILPTQPQKSGCDNQRGYRKVYVQGRPEKRLELEAWSGEIPAARRAGVGVYDCW